MAPNVVGIDLGTSSCSVAMMIDGRPQVLPVFDGHDEMPTYVAFTQRGERLVGWAAKRQSVMNAQNTIFTIKRLIGRKYADAEAQADLGLLPYKVVPSAAGGLWVEAGGRTYTPTEITAIMLAEVRRVVEVNLGSSISGAVITVPAYFDLSQIQATVEAAEIAGLEVMRVIAEPTAAALAYGFEQMQQQGLTAVYDLGGGTFDVSLLELGDGVFEVKAVNGDNRFGGEDFDHILVDHFVKQIQREQAVNLTGDPLALYRLKDAAEQIKIQLDIVESVAFDLPYLFGANGTFFNATLKLTRTEIEHLFEPLILRTLKPCEQAMHDAGLNTGEIDNLVLVGGMSRMPTIRRRVGKFFGCSPKLQLDPSRVVAYGAAIYASTLAGQIKNVLLLDVTPFPLGIAGPDGEFIKIIDGNTTIPTKKSVVLKIKEQVEKAEPGDVLVGRNIFEAFVKCIRVLQKGSLGINKNDAFVVLGEVMADFSRSKMTEDSKVEIIIDIDAGNVALVEIVDIGSGKRHSQRLRAFDPFDRRGQFSKEQLAARRAEADQLLNAVNKLDVARRSSLPKSFREQFEDAKLGLERAIQSKDTVELSGAIEALATVSRTKSAKIAAEPLPPGIEVKAAPLVRTVFISYAREDASWLKKLRAHLRPLERSEKIEIWDDYKLKAGVDWRLEIDRVLGRASSAVLLITANFLASDFIYENELPPILRRRQTEGLRVYPLIVTNSCFARIPELSNLGAFNDPGVPLSAMTDAEVDAKLAALANELWDNA